MGISLSFLEFFDLCHQQRALCAPMLALGTLQINDPEWVIRSYAERHPYWKRDPAHGVRSLFRDRYGVTDYRDCDLNDQADLTLDLNRPIAQDFRGTANTVLNGGTLEHIFDAARAFANMHELTREGGSIIHLAPISWYDHGYYNLNPKVFSAIADANKYCLVAEAFWFTSDVLRRTPVEPAAAGSENVEETMQPQCYITYDGHQYTDERGAISRLFCADFVPGNGLYLAAYKKTCSEVFEFPYDIAR